MKPFIPNEPWLPAVQVVPDGRRLTGLVQLLAQGLLTVSVGEWFPLERGAAALAQVRRGAHGTAIVLGPGGSAEPGATGPASD
jgi:hypothetical protein